MRLIPLLLPSMLFAALSAEADLNQCTYRDIHQTQVRVDEDFIDTYKSVEEYAHLFCRRQNCYRAYAFKVDPVDGDVSTGRVIREISEIKCTTDREASLRERLYWSQLNSTFQIMKRRDQNHARALPEIALPNSNTTTAETDFTKPFDEAFAGGSVD